MPPKIHLIRHAQGEHNATVSTRLSYCYTMNVVLTSPQRDYSIRDAVLTARGKEQCRTLCSAFKHHQDIDIVFASPLRRTIQTASLSFGPVLARTEVPLVLLPALQEVSNIGCDVGIADSAADIQELLPKLFKEGELDFDINKIDVSAVTEGWNSKVQMSRSYINMLHACLLTQLQKGYWAYEKQAISQRASDLRNWLYQRTEAQVRLSSALSSMVC
jgi:hypothetical protein